MVNMRRKLSNIVGTFWESQEGHHMLPNQKQMEKNVFDDITGAHVFKRYGFEFNVSRFGFHIRCELNSSSEVC